jgi:Mrp family chromosome partitioning ATPase
VLIIDTNFKNNTLTNLFSAPQQLPDVAFVFNNVKQLEENKDNITDTSMAVSVFQDERASYFIHDTLYKNIHIIGCKGSELSPSELFQGKNFGMFLDELKSEYDFIFLEGPSLNEFSDSKELIHDVDKVVTVFAADTTISQHDQLSIDYLKELNTKHIGSILNMVDLKNLHE